MFDWELRDPSLLVFALRIYRYLNFDEMASYMEAAEAAKNIPLTDIQEVA